MQNTKEQRNQVMEKVRIHATDTGSPEVQIGLLSGRISQLTEHFKIHSKDFAGRRGLLALVAKRRSLLDYLKKKEESRYTKIIKEFNIRR